MSGGQSATGVSLRTDLKEMMEEINWAEDQQLNAEKILPSISVAEPSAYYPVLPREVRLRIPNTNRGPNGTYNRDQWEWSTSSYNTKEYGFEEPIDLTQATINSSWVDEEEIAAQLAVEKLLLAREDRVASAVFNATTFTGATNFVDLSVPWDTSSTATPAANIEFGFQKIRGKCGLSKKQLSLIITEDNMNSCLRTSEVINSVLYTEAVATMSDERRRQFLVDYFGIKEIVLVNSMFDPTKDGNAAPQIGNLWSNEYMMLAILNKGSNSWKERGLGRQPNYSKFSDNYLIDEYDEQNKNAHIIRAREFRGTVVNTEYGFLFGNVKGTVDATTRI